MTCQIYDNFMTKGHKKSHRLMSVAWLVAHIWSTRSLNVLFIGTKRSNFETVAPCYIEFVGMFGNE